MPPNTVKQTLPAIKVTKCVFQYKKLKIPLLSGEFHYWRVPRENWGRIAGKIHDMGLEVVASYIPWNYHEFKPGRYDFTGRTSPQRDLKGFIHTLKQAGLYLIIRPGPYIYAEWPHGGPPERAVKHDRLSSPFLKMAQHYIKHVCKILVPEQISKGGNILMFQADNEPYPPIESFGDEIGCFKAPGMFKEWLQDRYQGDLAALNRAWKTSLTSFENAGFYFHEECVNTELLMADRLLPASEYHIRYADSFDFIGWYAAKVVATVAGWLREAGVNVPILANSWSPLYANFNYFCKVADLAGTDHYPNTFMEGAHPTKDNWFYNIDIVKMAEADVTHGNVWSAEFQSGCYPLAGVGYLPPRHFKFVLFTLMGRGLRGWNWFMLVNRDNWSHCPINEWGCTNEYFPVHQQVVAAARFIEPWNLTPLYDLSLLAYKPHRVIAPGNFDAVCRTLEQADLSYDYFNPHTQTVPRTGVLLYAGDDWLERKAAGQLNQFVREGGILVTFSRYPARDEFGEPLTGLPFILPEGARPTILPVKVSYRNGSVEVVNAGHGDCKVNFCYFRRVSGEPVMATLSTETREMLVDIGAKDAVSFAMGYAMRHGKGKIIYLGCNPSPAVLRMILEQENRAPYATATAPKLSSAVHRHHNGALALFVSNRADSATYAAIQLNRPRLGIQDHALYHVENAVTREKTVKKGRELAEVLVALEAHDAAILRIKLIMGSGWDQCQA